MGREGEEDKGERAEEQEREEGASSPFYSESGTPVCCQVTVGRSLDKMLTITSVAIYTSEDLPSSNKGQAIHDCLHILKFIRNLG